MSSIVVSYTAQDGSNTAYSITIDEFSGNDLPRSFAGDATFNRSANGTSILGGPAYAEKRIWAISVLLPKAKAEEILALFEAWDADRANGLPVACSVVDTTFGPSVTANALFSTPPSFAQSGNGGLFFFVDFALSEI